MDVALVRGVCRRVLEVGGRHRRRGRPLMIYCKLSSYIINRNKNVSPQRTFFPQPCNEVSVRCSMAAVSTFLEFLRLRSRVSEKGTCAY